MVFMDWLAITFYVLLAGFMPLGMLYVYFKGLRKGLIRKDNSTWTITYSEDAICVAKNGVAKSQVQFKNIATAVYAYDDGWTKSTLVENALSLYDRNRRLVAKFPESANGFWDVYRAIEATGVSIERIVVEAPSYLD